MRIAWLFAPALAASTMASAQDGLGGMLPPAPPPPASVIDPVGAAFARLSYSEVEDDLPKPSSYYDVDHNHMLTGVATSDCTSVLTAYDKHSWTIDWRTITEVLPGDTFVYVAGPGVKMGVVGDASKPDQANALAALYMAMRAMRERCGSKPGDNAEG